MLLPLDIATLTADKRQGAVLSTCGLFRYRLWRRWQDGPTITFIMLNPSTADATVDDATIRKCIGFAKRLGYSAIEVVNLFAFRATQPKDIKAAGWPVGEENDRHILEAATAANMVICAWGVNARGLQRPLDVLELLQKIGKTPKALRFTADGIPWHPLMLPYACEPADMPFVDKLLELEAA